MSLFAPLLALAVAAQPTPSASPAPAVPGVAPDVASMDAAPDAAMGRRLDAVIDRALRERRLVGTVVLVARDGRVVYRRAAGQADREAGVPMREDAIFRLASVTKPIVSVAAMRLVEQGKLRLDDPVTRWLPDFRPRLPDGDAPPITVHQLLTHTAGLSYGFEEADGAPYHRLRVSDGLDASGITLEENLRRIAAAGLSYPPGHAWRYSLAIDVLGAVVARANGSTLPEAVAQLVTGPLQMRDSAFSVAPSARVAVPYADGRARPRRMYDGIEVPLPPALGHRVRFAPSRAFDAGAFPSGGGGMVGTAGDVLRLLEMLRGGGAPLLRAETVARMGTDQVGIAAQTQGPGWGFGYGAAVLVDPALAGTPQAPGTLQWGGAYGHSWFVDRARGLSVVALTNTAFEGMSGAFPGQIRDAVYGAP
ncbi:serine hydrolase domain-containing protein [Luteimonas aquatica]|uniref:serine hydrolase domain-containing protein n=1 Tax=Luteimonas aquatica TaxID=450364 RepID=UPI001F5A9033|nr:serine hydrolase domain-containing protein [Luteimonas aquatica]